MLYSFNAILIAITLATFSSNQMLKPVFNIMFRIILTIFTQAAFTTLLKSFAIPVLTMPFILVSWLWLLFNQTLNQR
ncbi:hypothetical protein BHC44_12055 [Snodgrassella alvi]|nr:hypothetical protein BHC44_12055 [Snodgrassella alvi]